MPIRHTEINKTLKSLVVNDQTGGKSAPRDRTKRTSALSTVPTNEGTTISIHKPNLTNKNTMKPKLTAPHLLGSGTVVINTIEN